MPKSEKSKISKGVNQKLKKEIERVFNLQLQNSAIVSQTTSAERIAKLKLLNQKLFETREQLCTALFEDFQKNPAETEVTELYPVVSEIRHAIKNLKKWMKPVKVKTPISLLGSSARIQYQPKGVVAIISPWNYPVNLTLGPLVSAIAAGNCVIIKPSEMTPSSSKYMRELITGIFPENEVAIFEGDAAVSTEILSKPFHHIFYTGNPAVGKIVMTAAARNLTSVTLELGGKSPVVIDESADIGEAAKKISWAKFVNCGQTCIAPDYILVHDSLRHDFLALLKKGIAEKYGNTDEEIKKSKNLSRIINSRHFLRLTNLLNSAIKAGANIEYGGVTDAKSNYISPTILTEVPLKSSIMQEEIFGPLFPVITFSDLPEAIDYINSGEKPLAAYFYGKNKENIRRFIQKTSSGGVCINDSMIHFSNLNLPFGGINNSGLGNGHGIFGFKAFSHERAILRQHLKKPFLQMLYPPYTPFARKLIDLTVKYF